jgi:Domain of unknown function (DUF4403)
MCRRSRNVEAAKHERTSIPLHPQSASRAQHKGVIRFPHPACQNPARRRLTEVLALMTLTTSLPAHAAPALAPQSSLSLPVSVPLSSLKAAAMARLPEVLATVNQVQTVAGGLISVNLVGEVRRSGELVLVPEGDGLRLSLPVTATFRATPGGLGQFLARDFTGAALVTAHVRPSLSPQWNAGVQVQADYTWTDPLSFELLRGVSINVQTLVDPQIRSRLSTVSDALNTAARTGLKLRDRAEELWVRLAQPWTLPGIKDGYAVIRPQGLTATPIHFGFDSAEVTLGGTFMVTAGLGPLPVRPAGPPAPLPPLRIGLPATQGVLLEVPITLGYRQLSQLATRYAQAQEYPLPLPLGPRLKVQQVVLTTAGAGRLNAAVQLTVQALGIKVGATIDVSGTPKLEGQRLSLQNVTVKTRSGGLSSRVLGWLADARVQALVVKQASFDLAPELAKARAALQSRLPYRVSSGVTLSGQIDRLALRSVSVESGGVVATTQAQGSLEAKVELEK